MLELSLIAKSLWRNKLAPALLIIQLALSVAIISNALFFVQNRIELIQRPTGLNEEGLFKLWAKQSLADGDIEQTIQHDIELLKSLPGITHAAPTDSVPLSTYGWNTSFTSDLNDDGDTHSVPASLYMTTDTGVEALGVDLVEGRNFFPHEVTYFGFDTPGSTVAVVSRAFAERMFPNEPALNQVMYIDTDLVTIVGVVDRLMGHQAKDDNADVSVILPVINKTESINYLVRTSNSNVEEAMWSAAERLREVNQHRVIGHEQTYDEIRREAYSSDYAMIYLLCAVIALLVLVNALGIVGLTSLWVNQRKKQIGIRRALGATQLAVLRYFLVENGMLMTIAALLGAALALAGGVYLAKEYSAEIMHWGYIPATAATLAVITLVAALTPALRATRIAPATAVANG